MLNAQSLRNRAFLAKIGRAMRYAAAGSNNSIAFSTSAVYNAKGRCALLVIHRRGKPLSGFSFEDSDGRDVTPLVLSVLREHGDVADALPAKPAMVTPEDLPASLLLDLLPVDTHGREAFPYGRDALGRRADVPFTCGGAR